MAAMKSNLVGITETKSGNNGPKMRWHKYEIGECLRQTLYVDGDRSPYFIDSTDIRCHRAYRDHKHALWGSGMHPKGCALELATSNRIVELKMKAERFVGERV